MSLRTPLGQVRGLGSAKEGTEHWWAQRLTAVALVPLTFLFVALVFAFVAVGDDHARAAALMGNPFVAIVMLLFIVAGIYHMKLGMQVVIEDYVDHEAVKTVSLIALSLFSFAIGAACVFAVLKLAFGG